MSLQVTDKLLIQRGYQGYQATAGNLKATLAAPGLAQLSSSVTSTSEVLAATPKAAKLAYDRGSQGVNAAAAAQATADAALPKAGGTMSGKITFASGQTFPGTITSLPNASTSTAGIVKLTDSVSSGSTTTAATPASVELAYNKAAAALPKSGGTMTGTITFAQDQAYPGVLKMIPAASSSTAGLVKLNDSTASTATDEAATANAVRLTYDKANQALNNTKNALELPLSNLPSLP